MPTADADPLKTTEKRDAPDITVARGDAETAVRAAVDMLGGMKAFVRKGARVVIKPNMSFASGPESAANTHPEVDRTIAAMCREAGAGRVLVLDNPLSPAEQCLEASGIRAACADIDRDMVHTVSSRRRFAEVAIENAEALKGTDVMREVLASDVLIAAPVAKSHSGAGVSLSMKGMMGLIYNRRIMHRLDLHTCENICPQEAIRFSTESRGAEMPVSHERRRLLISGLAGAGTAAIGLTGLMAIPSGAFLPIAYVENVLILMRQILGIRSNRYGKQFDPIPRCVGSNWTFYTLCSGLQPWPGKGEPENGEHKGQ